MAFVALDRRGKAWGFWYMQGFWYKISDVGLRLSDAIIIQI